jgi:putative SOS response-associated peptidase YedK
MCGRYSFHVEKQNDTPIATLFGLNAPPPPFKPRFNIAPSQLCPVVRQNTHGRTLDMLRWGFVPAWAKRADGRSSFINARSESVHQKPAFKKAFQESRVLVPATGFYEWNRKTSGSRQQASYISVRKSQVFAFAGVWQRWQHNLESIDTFAILTTEPNCLVADIHNRMPVIFEPSSYDLWLNPHTPWRQLADLMQPYPAESMQMHQVSSRVNHTENDTQDCMEPAKEKLPLQIQLPW